MLRLPTTFTWHRPDSAADAVRIAADHGPTAMFVAGGTDLYPNMKRRHQTPEQVISLSGIADLCSISGDPRSGMTIGAAVTLTEIERNAVLQEAWPALVAAVKSISTPLLRNMGTIGGNMLLDTRCTYYNQTFEWREAISFCMKEAGEMCWVAPGSPRCWAVQSSDSIPLLTAIDAEVTLLGPDGERRISARELYNDDGIAYLTKKREELLIALHLPPVAAGQVSSYVKLRRRGTFDFPVLGVGASLKLAGDTVEDVRIRIGGAGSWPIPAKEAEDLLRGQALTEERIVEAARTAYKPARAMDNTDHEASWRKKMAPIFVARALREAAARG